MVNLPVEGICSSAPVPEGKNSDTNLENPLAERVEVGNFSASVSFGGTGMS